MRHAKARSHHTLVSVLARCMAGFGEPPGADGIAPYLKVSVDTKVYSPSIGTAVVIAGVGRAVASRRSPRNAHVAQCPAFRPVLRGWFRRTLCRRQWWAARRDACAPRPGSFAMNLAPTLLSLGFVGAVVTATLATVRASDTSTVASVASPSSRSLPAGDRLPPLDGATDWLNVAAAPDLHGRVVLVNFWTYSCINSLRQIPHVRAWADKYRDQGLTVIGVHAPEFDFERDIGNVHHAAAQLGVDYPVAIDNRRRIWDALENQYWPALYFVDAAGRIRHVEVGEGDYAKAERIIQQLLREAGATGLDDALAPVHAAGAQAPADWADLRSPESYLGHARAERLISPGGIRRDREHAYAAPPRLGLNQWALAGTWKMGPQATVAYSPGAHIAYRFHARDLHLVMAPPPGHASVRFRVTLERRPPGDAHGVDVDADGYGVVTEARMYQLIRQPMPIVDRHFEIEFLDPGVQVFAITFG